MPRVTSVFLSTRPKFEESHSTLNLTMQKRKFGPKIIWSYGDCKMGVKCIWVSDLEKSLGGMQRDIASTVHSTQQFTLLTAPTSYLPKRKRKAISFFSSFAAL